MACFKTCSVRMISWACKFFPLQRLLTLGHVIWVALGILQKAW